MSILNFLFRYHVKRKRIRQIPTRVVMVDHMGSATENQMESTILNGKGGDMFVWEEGVHGTSKSLSLFTKKRSRRHIQKQIENPRRVSWSDAFSNRQSSVIFRSEEPDPQNLSLQRCSYCNSRNQNRDDQLVPSTIRETRETLNIEEKSTTKKDNIEDDGRIDF